MVLELVPLVAGRGPGVVRRLYVARRDEISIISYVVRSHNLKIKWRFKIIFETHL